MAGSEPSGRAGRVEEGQPGLNVLQGLRSEPGQTEGLVGPRRSCGEVTRTGGLVARWTVGRVRPK